MVLNETFGYLLNDFNKKPFEILFPIKSEGKIKKMFPVSDSYLRKVAKTHCSKPLCLNRIANFKSLEKFEIYFNKYLLQYYHKKMHAIGKKSCPCESC